MWLAEQWEFSSYLEYIGRTLVTAQTSEVIRPPAWSHSVETLKETAMLATNSRDTTRVCQPPTGPPTGSGLLTCLFYLRD